MPRAEARPDAQNPAGLEEECNLSTPDGVKTA